MIHTRCMILGHDECQFDTIPTTSLEEQESFKKGSDWTNVDPVIDEFLKKS